MKTIKETKGYKVQFNGSSSYFLVDEFNTCVFLTNTLRKANNKLNRILKDGGLI